MKHCAGCRFWKPDQPKGACWRITAEADPKAELEELDGAVLRTAPDFGCTLHEPITAPEAG